MIEIQHAEAIFNFLYGNFNGYEVSKNARINFSGDTSNFLYGELPFQTFKSIIEKINPKADGTFFDLGSGTGRVTLEALLITNFKKIVGIELLDGLHNKALEIKEKFENLIAPSIAEHVKNRKLELIKGDLFTQDYSTADFILMNHPIKDCDLFLKLEEKLARELKPGTKIATTIRSLKNPNFKSLGNQNYKFSWGNATAHFFER
jgi:SAM-dependent methyltransferase